MEISYTDVQTYYGKELQTSGDLKTNACCAVEPPSGKIRQIIGMLSDEVKDKYYGCGLTIPTVLEGLHVLDLGSGSGRDCFIASRLVGEKGRVVGLDMTEEQLEVARRNIDYHTSAFGYDKSNVDFIQGNIDELGELGLPKASFDLIISNCVINLTKNKHKVLSDAHALLKPGGEMYFSDVYADRRIPKELQQHRELWNECLSGALYWNDFLNIARLAGFTDPRAMESAPISVENTKLEELVGDIRFYSVTYRLMKIDGLESDCEDYGQAVMYKGGVEGEESGFILDDHHYFPKGKVMPVCGNSYRMLGDTRFASFFDFYGTWETHYGIFEGCGTEMPFGGDPQDEASSSCC